MQFNISGGYARRYGVIAAILGLACFIAVGNVTAQTGTAEFGVDAALGYSIYDEDVFANDFTLTFPVPRMRVGFFVSDMLSIEPSAAIDLTSSDGETYTAFALGLGVSFHFPSDRQLVRAFVSPVGGMLLFSGGGDSLTQFSVGGELGVKVPLKDVMAFRFAAGAGRFFESDDVIGYTQLYGSFGLSFFVGGY